MSDGTDLSQFMFALGEMARGVATHLISPVWGRHILDARHQARITFTHREYDEVEAPVITPITILPFDNSVQRSVFFSLAEVSLLRSLLPLHLRHSLMVARGKRIHIPNVIGTYTISDLTNARFEDADFGWGKAMFAGIAIAVGVISLLMPTKNTKVGRVALVCLPAPTMERYAKELENMLKHRASEGKKSKSNSISSAM
ncbi:hypothetical protein CXB51_034302 [Gossypium anomalum]|uniref:Uncharacterized protein n=1 Tax=Gossypium anomalum TaxID=47600 RepID=A0A8J5Y5I9_9ROSI|nr:hypothetical protein CXB51_034302 [Gossypium anomalum]